ncbi:MAG TPA: tetratricopeptide repeat protein [Terracidiphilus sp.]|nr:tetratricopeptide repeat protein [Terracidiphilus sp.]
MTNRKSFVAAAVLLLFLGAVPQRAHAVSKEMVQLQTQVQQLLDMVQRLQSTMDTRFAVLQNLAQQTADQATQMSSTVNAMQQKLNTQVESLSGKLDTSQGQVQGLNDSVDELKTRIDKLQKTVSDMQNQLQNVQQAPPAGAPAPGDNGQPQQQNPGGQGMPANQPAPQPQAVNQAPPLEQTYQAAVSDFNAAKYQLATSEFQDVIRYYPMDTYAGGAQFYLGEIAYRQKNYDDAVKAYNVVLEQFSGNPKAATAQLHKGLSLIASNRRQAGVEELRSLVHRHPQTPEAQMAREKLNALGVRINPTH